jgi:MFS transporter, putative metabolite:H+ symporter
MAGIGEESSGLGLGTKVKFTILVAALGYLVDVFDLILYTLLRNKSLTELGVPKEQLKDVGAMLLNWQMAGFIVGGILWGILGDKRGRLSTLLGSILIYSIANIANGFVQTIPQYAAIRFIAAIGLAGEIGAGVALASELLPQRLRGWGTTFIAVIGLIGAILASFVVDHLGWRSAYWIGGGMGLILLVLRLAVVESSLYNKVKLEAHSRGDFLKFLSNGDMVGRLLLVTLVGTPIWFAIGLLVTFTPEISADMGMPVAPKVSSAVMWVYIGLGLGGIFSGFVSQKLQSRKKAIGIWLSMLVVAIILYAIFARQSLAVYYSMITLLGFGAGYWNMFLQVAAEQFGTNYRATAASSAPNLVRGTTIPMVWGFQLLSPTFGPLNAVLIVGAAALIIAFASLIKMSETFHRDLDFVEPI